MTGLSLSFTPTSCCRMGILSKLGQRSGWKRVERLVQKSQCDHTLTHDFISRSAILARVRLIKRSPHQGRWCPDWSRGTEPLTGVISTALTRSGAGLLSKLNVFTLEYLTSECRVPTCCSLPSRRLNKDAALTKLWTQ